MGVSRLRRALAFSVEHANREGTNLGNSAFQLDI